MRLGAVILEQCDISAVHFLIMMRGYITLVCMHYFEAANFSLSDTRLDTRATLTIPNRERIHRAAGGSGWLAD